jgi:hypothetical protein
MNETEQTRSNTIPVLMHQMRILTNDVSSVMLRPKNLEVRKNVKTVKSWEKPQTNHHHHHPTPHPQGKKQKQKSNRMP